MVKPPQTIRSERTRDALRRAALLRFLAQGVEETSAEQIAADAGVTLRTFYRHFASKHDLLFADYDASLHWFRQALAARPEDESIVVSVREAIFAFPYDVQALTQIAALRAETLDAAQIVGHLRRVEADFADVIAQRLAARPGAKDDDQLAALVTARCIAAAVFATMDFWMQRGNRTISELAEATRAVLDSLAGGMFRQY